MEENKIMIGEYQQFRKNVENAKKSTLKSESFILLTFDKYLGDKSFKVAKENDIIGYLDKYSDTTKDMRTIFLKKFYRWLFNLEKGERLPDCVRRIKTTVRSPMNYYNDTEYRERIVTEVEYEKLLDSSQKIMHAAMIETLYNFGCRASELLSMNAEDVSFDGSITKITVRNSKQIPRDIVYPGRSEYLLKWYENYQQFKGQRDKPLWTNYQKNKHNRYTINGLEKAIKVISKRAGLRRIRPHDLRHTSVTNARKNGIPITHIETNFGYTHGSPMMKVYDHNKTKDFEEYLRMRSKEEKPTYELLQKQKDTLESNLKKEIANLKVELAKKTEIDNFIMDSLGIIAKEMVEKQGIEAIKELFLKYNVPLAKD